MESAIIDGTVVFLCILTIIGCAVLLLSLLIYMGISISGWIHTRKIKKVNILTELKNKLDSLNEKVNKLEEESNKSETTLKRIKPM